MPEIRLAAVVVNDRGEVLPATTRGSMEQCAEAAIALWGIETWTRLQELGARVAQCEIRILDPQP